MSIRVLIVEDDDATRHLFSEAVQAASDGYILKCDAFMAIEPAILRVMDNESPVSPAVARYLLKRFRPSKSIASELTTMMLTRREQQILEELACGMSYQEVAKPLCLSYHTVSAHVQSTYRKLKINSRGQAVAEGVRSGLISIE